MQHHPFNIDHLNDPTPPTKWFKQHSWINVIITLMSFTANAHTAQRKAETRVWPEAIEDFYLEKEIFEITHF